MGQTTESACYSLFIFVLIQKRDMTKYLYSFINLYTKTHIIIVRPDVSIFSSFQNVENGMCNLRHQGHDTCSYLHELLLLPLARVDGVPDGAHLV